MPFKFMDFLFFHFFARLDEWLREGCALFLRGMPKTGDEKEQGELGEFSEVSAGFQE